MIKVLSRRSFLGGGSSLVLSVLAGCSSNCNPADGGFIAGIGCRNEYKRREKRLDAERRGASSRYGREIQRGQQLTDERRRLKDQIVDLQRRIDKEVRVANRLSNLLQNIEERQRITKNESDLMANQVRRLAVVIADALDKVKTRDEVTREYRRRDLSPPPPQTLDRLPTEGQKSDLRDIVNSLLGFAQEYGGYVAFGITALKIIRRLTGIMGLALSALEFLGSALSLMPRFSF